MSAEPGNGVEREGRLDEVLVAYLEAVEAGQAPDRQEWLARHPDMAADLAEFFTDQDQFDTLVAPLRTVTAKSPTGALTAFAAPDAVTARPAPGKGRVFGDYELLEEIARGGMGVVYRARQIRLNRLVALKMILAGPWATPAEVARFRREAEAVAQLDHPHIVPIYEIGEHDGQYYFSMKLIEGGSLARWIAEKCTAETQRAQRRPKLAADLRDLCVSAVKILTLAARAVHYAHQRGILHRDLKPANILLDMQGQPHVSDFGLAKHVDASQSLTQSGVAVGTPSYMAPEQAAGPKKALTPAADVYSLGAILYEVLTGRPPFQAETPLETLWDVLERQPEPVRVLNPSVPRDLETICHKCLEKDPSQRYPSAAALADDLERFLPGQPIRARPVGNLERLGRWCWRHPGLATACVLAILGLWTVAIVSLLLAVSESRKAARLNQVNQDLQQVETRAQDAERQRDLAQDALRAVEEQRKRERESLRQTCRDLHKLYLHLDKRLEAVPALQPFRAQLRKTELAHLESFCQQQGQDPDLWAELAKAHYRAGDLHGAAGARDNALANYQQAQVLLRKLVGAYPDDLQPREDLAKICHNLGNFHRVEKPAEALESYRQAQAAFQQLIDRKPDDHAYRNFLAGTLNNLADVLQTLRRDEEARAVFQEAVLHQRIAFDNAPEKAEYRQSLSSLYGNLARANRLLGRPTDAATATRERHKLWPDDPDEHYRAALDLAKTAIAVGRGKPELSPADQAERGQYLDEAMAALRQAVDQGFKDVERLQKEEGNFSLLRSRDDFKKLLAGLMSRAKD